MPFQIVRNDLVKMEVDAIVNTANPQPTYSSGTDTAVYKAAGEEELLAARKAIGCLEEGQVAITPGFKLPAKYIVHAVSPMYIDGQSGEEEKLRGCYRRSMALARQYGCRSIAFPLIATGAFGYPKEEGMSIAIDEISKFLLYQDMMVYLVVFDTKATELALRLQPALDAYIDHHYVCEKREEEYGDPYFGSVASKAPGYEAYRQRRVEVERQVRLHSSKMCCPSQAVSGEIEKDKKVFGIRKNYVDACVRKDDEVSFTEDDNIPSPGYLGIDESALDARVSHISDTFCEYLFYLIEQKGLKNKDVYQDAYVTKQTFSKMKLNPDYHPDKGTALRLCVGARLSLDETKDLLARAGYALSPCDRRDIIFQFYIENQVYEMDAIDVSLEEYGVPCFVG